MRRAIRADERSGMVSDGLLALALTVFAQLDLHFDLDNSTSYGSGFAAAAATAAATSVLALRRRAPLPTLCAVVAAVAGPELFARLTITLWGDYVPLLIATYSVARHARFTVALAGAGVSAVGLLVVALRVPVIGTAANIPFDVVPFSTALVAGQVLRRRQDRHADAAARARRLEAERDETIRAAVTDERNRIARELHDIVAHCVSVMVIQAGAAEDLLDREPGQARAPLRSVQETGRQAVAELGRMLGLLRGERADLALTPQPDTAQLHELAEQMNQAGLPVTFTVEGVPRPLSPGAELTIYRVVQEALTNTLKHAGAASTRVTLRYGEHAVEISILDRGQGSSGNPHAGHGLIGMRERVSIYGGSVQAGDLPEGGFAVRAVLPADEAGLMSGMA